MPKARSGTSSTLSVRDNQSLDSRVKIRVLPARITNRIGHRYPTPGYRWRMIWRQGSIPLPLIAQHHVGRSPRRPRPWWSRPMPTDVCSMFARMPRYTPAASGIRSESRMPATGQNGSSRHVLASLDSSQAEKANEQSSGLLIRGFGVQVPGGAPVLTWGFRLQVVLLSELVGPWWVQCGTSFSLLSFRFSLRAR
jgi:hypothetical protein